jgi:hypothetical protein
MVWASEPQGDSKHKEETMIRMFIRHPVEDYARWRQGYDDFDEERKGMGVVGDAVYQSADDPNNVTVWHDFETLEAAQEFNSSPRLREVMANIGVVGEPQIWLTTEAT